ncbi:MAG TPA: hypothetical protein VM659_09825, partial [Dongiaceae bacterium]|nr:hypothetical protein [Dongiaceae bacterium]
MTMARREVPSADEQIDRQVRQSYYSAVSRHLSQIAGILLLLLHDRNQHRIDQHLPALAASAAALTDHLATTPVPADRHLLAEMQDRLAAIRHWIGHLPTDGQPSATEIAAALDDLQRLRDHLLAAGRRSCRFGMVQFAAGCC